MEIVGRIGWVKDVIRVPAVNVAFPLPSLALSTNAKHPSIKRVVFTELMTLFLILKI